MSPIVSTATMFAFIAMMLICSALLGKGDREFEEKLLKDRALRGELIKELRF